MNDIELPPRVDFQSMGSVALIAYARRYRLGNGVDAYPTLAAGTIATTIKRRVRQIYEEHDIPYEKVDEIDWKTLNLV